MKQYYKHLCACGCGGRVEVKKFHKYYGIPEFILGHHPKGKKRIFSEEHRRNIRKSKTGKKNTKLSKRISGKGNPMYGRVAELNPAWKGGITSKNTILRMSTVYKNWRISVFERDNYICQICGQVGCKLNAHHLESFNNNPKLRTTLSNGITLCKKCHKDFHHQYGRGDNTKEQFERFACGY